MDLFRLLKRILTPRARAPKYHDKTKDANLGRSPRNAPPNMAPCQHKWTDWRREADPISELTGMASVDYHPEVKRFLWWRNCIICNKPYNLLGWEDRPTAGS